MSMSNKRKLKITTRKKWACLVQVQREASKRCPKSEMVLLPPCSISDLLSKEGWANQKKRKPSRVLSQLQSTLLGRACNLVTARLRGNSRLGGGSQALDFGVKSDLANKIWQEFSVKWGGGWRVNHISWLHIEGSYSHVIFKTTTFMIICVRLPQRPWGILYILIPSLGNYSQ